MTLPSAPFPDPFKMENGERVPRPGDWPVRRREIRALIEKEYGPLPPSPGDTAATVLYQWRSEPWHGATHQTLRLEAGSQRWMVELILPKAEGPVPVLVNGDVCWRRMDEDTIRDITGRGYGLTLFNRLEIAHDSAGLPRVSGLDSANPGATFGSVACWAWAYHRVVDWLLTRPEVRSDAIAVAGHSRGGKAVLLAGATDERIALTAPNNSGCGGAGSHLWQPDTCEALERMTKNFPHWLAEGLAIPRGEERRLGFDQHFLKALVAPRAFLSTEALGDLWANPEGSFQTHRAARPVFEFLNAESNQAIHFREGGHDHTREDWGTLLDFADWVFHRKPLPEHFHDHPFGDLPLPLEWKKP